ncbi:porin [Flavobacterium sp. UMI-01]|uniref:porin n=1 Tax=Flavobacterium sp. UMI-01 TaxID=1441053 RepID=UPI001C7DCD25|nr:porin [Flavobacterium sp. UMI-01]GIZ09949.1 porin [Flavobacterium sp. UMI-01]
MKKSIFSIFTLLFFVIAIQAQNGTDAPKTATSSTKKWYEAIGLRGYMQVRYNKLLETNPDLGCEQCDKSWGGENSFFIRRGRLVFSGNVHDRIYIYIQPDFASSASSTSNHFFQIRDAYVDISLDSKKEFRFRVGQSKVPYGFENMQSSQNRLTLDRNDALNSAVANERDLGVMFYWAPKGKRELFSKLISDGLKGSGDYGVVGLGIYNGQTANRSEANNNQHVVGRVSYPFEFDNGQVLETGIQGYTGKYVVQSISTSKSVVVKPNGEYLDQRAAASVILYPKPFGLQAEYNIGTGPEYNKANNTIEQKRLYGGYVQGCYNIKIDQQVMLPFVKYQMYRGGKKHELDARSYSVNDLEIGVEWQPFKNLELVADYTISSRRYEDAVKVDNSQKGNLLRLQLQINF